MKYIIDIPDDAKYGILTCKVDRGYYTKDIDFAETEQLNADYINEHFGDLQDTAYQRGLNDAWECARKLFSSMADSDIEKAFPAEWNNGGFNALMNLQPQYAIAKLKAYEEKQKADDKIEVGDELIAYGGLKCIATVADYDNDIFYVLFGDGSSGKKDVTTLKKTGRHFDIDKILEGLRYDD